MQVSSPVSWARPGPSSPRPWTGPGMFALVIFLTFKSEDKVTQQPGGRNVLLTWLYRYFTASWAELQRTAEFNTTYNRRLHLYNCIKQLLPVRGHLTLNAKALNRWTHFQVQWRQKSETGPLVLSSWPPRSPCWRHLPSDLDSSSVQRLMDSVCKSNKSFRF